MAGCVCDMRAAIVLMICHTNTVRELLSVPRIDVNLAQKQGATALQAAVQEGHVKVVELLLRIPAKMNTDSSLT